MRRILYCLIALIFAAAGLTSCKKYPEGPALSFRTKKARLVNTWLIERYLVGGEDKTEQYIAGINGFVFELGKTGAFKRTWSTSSGVYTDEGNWSLMDKKETLLISYTNINKIDTLQILKLEHKQLWLKEKDSDPEIEFHYRK